MSLEVAKEVREKFAEMISFWIKPSVLKRLDTACRFNLVERSEILRLLVDLWLNDYDLQQRVLEIRRRNHV